MNSRQKKDILDRYLKEILCANVYDVAKESKFAGKKVGNSGLPEWSRIAFIQRRNTAGFWETLRPAREKTIVEGDRLILFCRPDRVADLEKRFKV